VPSPRHARPRPSTAPATAQVGTDALRELGGMGTLALDTLGRLGRRRPTWIREALIQAVFITRTVLQPVMAVNAIFALSIIGLALGIPLEQLGAIDRSAAFLGPGLIREFGVFMTGAVFAGVIGTTYTAELGARRIREEIEALEVLGVDTRTAMVVPRVVAMTVMSPVIFLLGLGAGAGGTYLATTLFFDAPGATFLPQLLSNTSWIDLWAAIGKVALFGFVIAVISCHKGLTAGGGAEGVGRAVNDSVVACLVAVFFVNIVYTQLLLSLSPDLSVFR
jgi:phospholipid/cholesterol/gamma-HCH transport system permease protein